MLIDIEKLSKKYEVKSKGVLHIGAHIGQEAEMYNQLGMKKMIFIEANPSIFDQLRVNIKKYPAALAIKACISDKDGETVTFNISSNEGQSSSILELGTHKDLHPDVSYTSKLEMVTSRVDTVLSGMDLSGIDFLNIDLQGMELPALKSMGNLLSNFRYAYLEVNREQVYKGCAEIQEIDSFLATFGFERKETDWVNGWGDAFYVREPKEVLPGTFADPLTVEHSMIISSAPVQSSNPSIGKKMEKGYSTYGGLVESMIVPVDEHFLPVADNFERWFAENISSEELADGRLYLPVQWSAYYTNHKMGRDTLSLGQAQHLIDSLDKKYKYFTIVEWPEGVLHYFNEKDIKVFGTGNVNIDFKIDLTKKPEEVKAFILSKIK